MHVVAARSCRSWRHALAIVTLLAAAASPLVGQAPAMAQTGSVGVWDLTGSLSVARFDHTTTLLANGKVLAAGGRNILVASPVNFNSTEVYDPLTDQWTATGNMNQFRWRHTATLLPNGKVLVAGGFGGSPTGSGANAQPVLNTAELYDPATGVWTPTGNLNTRRGLHSAALLPNGKVLVAGGRTCDQAPPATCNFTFRTNTAELYDPATGVWTPTASLSENRHTTAAVVLKSGKVLVPAGFTELGNSHTANVYDPGTGTWSQTGNLNFGRARQGGMLLNDGRVLVGLGFPAHQTTEIYNPATNTWAFADDLEGFTSRFNFNYAVLPNGKALVAGGQTNPPPAVTRNSDIYDPATNQWSPGGLLNDLHGSGSSLANSDLAVVLSSITSSYAADPAVCGRNCGKVLVAGNSPTGTSELYTAADTCDGFTPTIVGTPGNDRLLGTPGRDVIMGVGGDDQIAGLGGDDVVCGGDGSDLISGDAGNDVVLGGEGIDRLSGGDGTDALFAEGANDDLDGGAGTDTADGGAGTDRCVAEITRNCP